MTKEKMIVIPCDGISSGANPVRAIYDPAVNDVLQAVGGTSTKRASHVEPGSGLSQNALTYLCPDYAHVVNIYGSPLEIHDEYANKWFADMTPVGGQVLGPFDDRDAALTAEVEWLHANDIPVHCPQKMLIAIDSLMGAPLNTEKTLTERVPPHDPPAGALNYLTQVNEASKINVADLMPTLDFEGVELRVAESMAAKPEHFMDTPAYSQQIGELTRRIHDPNTSEEERVLLRATRFGLAYGNGGVARKVTEEFPPATPTQSTEVPSGEWNVPFEALGTSFFSEDKPVANACVQLPEVAIDALVTGQHDLSEATGPVLDAYRLRVAQRLRGEECKGKTKLSYSEWTIERNTFMSDIISKDTHGNTSDVWRFQLEFEPGSCMIRDKTCGKMT
jgi:hypothetical protein